MIAVILRWYREYKTSKTQYEFKNTVLPITYIYISFI